ncbi:MAG TPA: hypothetical protein DCO75_09945 [Fibrobacteres bacterium]|nr:hypothetical protein [Fibrobacterota bacterium]
MKINRISDLYGPVNLETTNLFAGFWLPANKDQEIYRFEFKRNNWSEGQLNKLYYLLGKVNIKVKWESLYGQIDSTKTVYFTRME